MHVKKIQLCRVCGNKFLEPIMSLGSQYLQGTFVTRDKGFECKRKLPLDLVRCNTDKNEDACGLLQLAHSVPKEILYSSYWYRSGTNTGMRNHLKHIVDTVVEIINDCKDKLNQKVLDIGMNDGTMLGYYPDTFYKVGIDPSDIALNCKDESVTVINDIFPSSKLEDFVGHGLKNFDVISSIAMFYDLDNPIDFVCRIERMLSRDGIWVFEQSYMPKMLEMNAFDSIVHEHLEFYSLAVIERILKYCRMKLFKVEQNDTNGGSICCYATPIENELYDNKVWQKEIHDLRIEEFSKELDTDKPYIEFGNRVNKVIEDLKKTVKEIKDRCGRVHGVAASTKGNVILQACGFDNTVVDCIADRNPEKWGGHTLGTNIPIVSEEESRKMKPDACIVLAWHFKNEIIEREKEYLAAGGKLIFPLPNVHFI